MRVLLAFDDRSLGGTSRSALQFAKAWKQAGADVAVYAPLPPHATRVRQLTELGIKVYQHVDANMRQHTDLIHLHHGAPSPSTKAWVRELLIPFATSATPIFTHNIFGQGLANILPSDKTVVGVLGAWVAHQYKSQTARTSPRIVRLIPNPQDLQFFRPPTLPERQIARAKRKVNDGCRVILRVGSPNSEKWELRPYLELARRVTLQSDYQLRLMGCPDELFAKLPRHARIVRVPMTDDDAVLREEYWAADVFAHWAHRGETFGNVLLEALGTGLPVIYRSRPFRDNTPWEFQDIRLFTYARSRRSWVCSVFATRARNTRTQPAGLIRYSSTGLIEVLAHLNKVFDHKVNNSPSADLIEEIVCCLQEPPVIPMLSRLAVVIRHNIFTAHLKEARLNLISEKSKQ